MHDNFPELELSWQQQTLSWLSMYIQVLVVSAYGINFTFTTLTLWMLHIPVGSFILAIYVIAVVYCQLIVFLHWLDGPYALNATKARVIKPITKILNVTKVGCNVLSLKCLSINRNTHARESRWNPQVIQIDAITTFHTLWLAKIFNLPEQLSKAHITSETN